MRTKDKKLNKQQKEAMAEQIAQVLFNLYQNSQNSRKNEVIVLASGFSGEDFPKAEAMA